MPRAVGAMRVVEHRTEAAPLADCMKPKSAVRADENAGLVV